MSSLTPIRLLLGGVEGERLPSIIVHQPLPGFGMTVGK